MRKEDEVCSVCVCELKVERFVGLLVPVRQPQSHVERRRTQHEQVVTQQLFAVLATVDRQSHVAGTTT